MLKDIERKVLRIIGNFSAGRRRMPTVNELCIKTGRSREGVMRVLEALNREYYIEWSKHEPDKIVLIEAWERKSSISRVVSTFDPSTSPFCD